MHGDTPRLLEGGLSVDDRGSVAFVNDFDLKDSRRFYVVSDHAVGFVRAWHYHRRECKHVFAVSGDALVQAVRVEDPENPPEQAERHRFVLTASKPAVLYIPPGYANGMMTLTAGTRLIFFSNATLEESVKDDIRIDADRWGGWTVAAR